MPDDGLPDARTWGRLEQTLVGIQTTQTRIEKKLNETTESFLEIKLGQADTKNRLESHEKSDNIRFRILGSAIVGLGSIIAFVAALSEIFK